MESDVLAGDLIRNLENRIKRLERREERRRWRDNHDPFELEDDVFIELFRIPQDVAIDIIEELRPNLRRLRPYGYSPECQVLTALRFYAVGYTHGAVGEQWDLAVSQPSLNRCIIDVTNAINDLLFRRWVKFPMSPADRQAAKDKFLSAPHPFVGAIGAVDSSYIKIAPPKQHEYSYLNDWGDYTINVQAICEPDLKIININARFPGSRNSAYIWSSSAARTNMERQYNSGERDTWLIGDDKYCLEPWLMTPLRYQHPDSPRFRYNEDLCNARSCSDRFFGVFKSEFRCLSTHRQLMYEPSVAGKIVNACATLHNIRVESRLHDVVIDETEIEAHRAANRPNPDVDAEEDRDEDVPLYCRALAVQIQNNFISRQYGRF